MKSKEEIEKTIEGMKAIRSKIVLHSMFGDNNLASFDIVLNVFENRMDLDDVDEHYNTAGVSEEDYMLALEAADWLAGEEVDFDPIENWSLVEEEN